MIWVNCSIEASGQQEIYYDGNGGTNLKAYNSIFSGTLLEGGSYSGNEFYYCLFTDNINNYADVTREDVINNSDPMLIDDLLRLDGDSPAKNSGLDDWWTYFPIVWRHGITTDALHMMRVIGPTIDMGACEVVYIDPPDYMGTIRHL